MKLIPIGLAGALLMCTGCHTVIIRPASAPVCEMPTEFRNACPQTATLGAAPTYGELPKLALDAGKDFAECRATYIKVVSSFDNCIAGLKNYNESVKKLEEETKQKYKNATVIQGD